MARKSHASFFRVLFGSLKGFRVQGFVGFSLCLRGTGAVQSFLGLRTISARKAIFALQTTMIFRSANKSLKAHNLELAVLFQIRAPETIT